MIACPACGTEVPAFAFCGACGSKLEVQQPAAPAPQSAPEAAPQTAAGKLTLVRSDRSEGESYDLREGDNPIGRDYGEIFEGDGYLSPRHAAISITGGKAVVRDEGSLNGVFVRIRDEEELQDGQIIRIGQELLRFNFMEAPQTMKDGTELMGSPNPGYWGKITVVIGDGIDGSAYPLLGESVSLGRERGDINFPEDGYVSGLHAKLSLRDDRAYLADVGSSNGTFLKIDGDRALFHEAEVLLGQQLFRLKLA